MADNWYADRMGWARNAGDMPVIDQNGNVLHGATPENSASADGIGYRNSAVAGGEGNAFYSGDIGRYGGLADKYRGMTGQRIDRTMIDQDIGLGEQSRNEMLGALNMLAQRAQTGDTPATQQLRQMQAQNMASLRGGAMSARGGGAARAAAAQAARSTGARSGQSNAVGMGALQAAEMDRARQQYMQQATALRAADLQRRGMSAEEAFRQANLNQKAYEVGQGAALGYEGLRAGQQGFANDAKLRDISNRAGQSRYNAQMAEADMQRGVQSGLGISTGILGAVAQQASKKKDGDW